MMALQEGWNYGGSGIMAIVLWLCVAMVLWLCVIVNRLWGQSATGSEMKSASEHERVR